MRLSRRSLKSTWALTTLAALLAAAGAPSLAQPVSVPGRAAGTAFLADSIVAQKVGGWSAATPNLGMVDGESWVPHGSQSHRHGNAVIAMWVDDGILLCWASCKVPGQSIIALKCNDIAQLEQFLAQGFAAVTLLEPQGAQPSDAEGPPHQAQHDHEHWG